MGRCTLTRNKALNGKGLHKLALAHWIWPKAYWLVNTGTIWLNLDVSMASLATTFATASKSPSRAAPQRKHCNSQSTRLPVHQSVLLATSCWERCEGVHSALDETGFGHGQLLILHWEGQVQNHSYCRLWTWSFKGSVTPSSSGGKPPNHSGLISQR